MADETVAHPLKRCTMCGESKPATKEFFHIEKRWGDGLTAGCRPCRNAASRASSRKSFEADPERARAIGREKMRRYYAADPERYRKRSRDWHHENRDACLAKARAWKAANPDKCKQYKKRWHDKRRQTSEGALKHRIGVLMRRSLRSGKGEKQWSEIVGYTVDELRKHLERQFVKGMNWENFSAWQVDHILPLSSFKFTSAEDPEFRAAWALTNLRPLWSGANASKGAKRLHLI